MREINNFPVNSSFFNFFFYNPEHRSSKIGLALDKEIYISCH